MKGGGDTCRQAEGALHRAGGFSRPARVGPTGGPGMEDGARRLAAAVRMAPAFALTWHDGMLSTLHAQHNQSHALTAFLEVQLQ